MLFYLRSYRIHIDIAREYCYTVKVQPFYTKVSGNFKGKLYIISLTPTDDRICCMFMVLEKGRFSNSAKAFTKRMFMSFLSRLSTIRLRIKYKLYRNCSIIHFSYSKNLEFPTFIPKWSRHAPYMLSRSWRLVFENVDKRR